MRCPSCDHDNRPERRFCTRRGAALAPRCAASGPASEPGEKFCGACGAALAADPPASVTGTPVREPDSTLPAGERRQLTVLFCDLVGSTAIAGQLDPEDWHEIAARYQRAAA